MAIRVGVAGCRRGRGPLAMLHHHPEAEVVAVADPVAATRDAVADSYQVKLRFDTCADLLTCDEVDAVVIATPAPQHAEQVVAALDAGRHVLSEVPAAMSLDEARAVVQAVRRSAASYSFGENVNYMARTVAWSKFLASGRLGPVFYAEAEYVHDCRHLMAGPDGEPTWRAFLPPIQYCTHSLGPLLEWTGDRCVSAVALSTGSHCNPPHGTLDAQVALFRTASGAVFKVLCGFSLACEPGRHYYCLYGPGGMLESGRAADTPDRGYLADEPEATRGPAPEVVPPDDRTAPEYAGQGGHGNAEWFMIDAWVRSLVDGGPPPIDVDAGMDMTLPGICANLSSEREGEAVAIPDSREW